MSKNLFVSITMLSLLVILSVNYVQAQTSAYRSIIFPYEADNIITYGDMNYSNTGLVTNMQYNPGRLAFLTKGSVYAIYTLQNTSYNFNYEYGTDPGNRWVLDQNPGLIAMILPLSLGKKNLALGLSGEYIPTPEFDFPDGMQWDEMTRITHNRSGNVWNANLALSTDLFKNLGIGLNVSRWFGNWKWEDFINFENFGSGTFNYSGTNLALGVRYQFSRFQAGLTLYSPFTLMTGDNLEIKSWFFNAQNRDVEQKFDGAGRLGLSYELNPLTRIGIAYRLQGKIYFKNYSHDDNLRSYTETYGFSHQFSASAQHEFQWQSVKLPVFLSYQMTSMPESPAGGLRDYQQISITEKDNLHHSVAAGVHAVYHFMGFYLAGRWDQGKIRVMNNSTPPWS